MSNQEPANHDINLAKMPSEIILSIAEHMDRQSLRNLALTSSRLHQTVRSKFYRGFNHETFRLALEEGDFAMIQRCMAHDAAPVDVTWGREHPKSADDENVHSLDRMPHDRPQYFDPVPSDLHRYVDHKPINYLIPAFGEGKMTADECLHVLRWLVENGGDIAAACADFRDKNWDVAKLQIEFGRNLKLMPYSILRLLVAETDRAKLDGIASMICYLLAQGFNFSRCMPVFNDVPDPRRRDGYPKFVPLIFSDPGCMARMMNSACPPSVLEAFLKQLRHQGVMLTSPLEKGPKSLRNVYWLEDGKLIPFERDTLVTQTWSLVVELYNDLLDPARWKPAYDGEVGDIWEAKLDLLDTYKGVDDSERATLRSILAGLRKIEAKARAEGGLVIKRDQRACWRELAATLSSYTHDPDTASAADVDSPPAERVHSFSLSPRPDPEKIWERR
ncbi:hypothetical protein N0V84_005487 [Fusarium piperis]|uniref:F-box domain-containing protein n=1 Tax=Fusarium piperis TaxID=1435070 RepID=A0A9W8WDS1_9HYPO|nr:hypothetical protein N0V84_005487 [Fusarium piperis]